MIHEERTMNDYSEDAATFGDRLALARESQSLTQAQLAKRLGLRIQTVQNWEFDRSEPRANRLQMLAGFLNVSIIWLLTGEGVGGPELRVSDTNALPAELLVLLGEIRDIRVANVRANDRLAKLEKRLRTMSELT
jgi:transcriptional regulator with XRE-family HTH domain